MHNKLKKICTVLIIILSTSCQAQSDKQAVRDYLTGKGISDYKELEWSERDSVYSPFNAELSLSYFKSKIETDIYILELDCEFLSPNSRTYKAKQDSIKALRSELIDLQLEVAKQKTQKVKNREGITLLFFWKDEEFEWTFIFNNDGKTIGHVLEYGSVLEL